MSGVTIERLPPERDAVAPGAAAAGGCCCCCCCCLHSLGGLVFAATARSKPMLVADPPPDAKTSVAREYWLTLLGLTLLATVFMATQANIDEALLYVAIFLPGGQLLASIATLVMSELSNRPGRRERLRHLGGITLRGFIGGLIGFGVMYAIFTSR